MRGRFSFQAVGSVAKKEFIHIYRDWRILVLLLILPPVFTLIFGHAFESTSATDVPALLENADHSPLADAFVSNSQVERFQLEAATRYDQAVSPISLRKACARRSSSRKAGAQA